MNHSTMKRTIILFNKKSEKQMPKFIKKEQIKRLCLHERKKKTVYTFTKWWPAKESSVK